MYDDASGFSNFTILDAHDVVTGLTGTKNLYNKDIQTRVEDGRIVKIGMEGNFDTEMVLAAHPDVIFISPFKRGGYEPIKETGITLVPHLGYKEPRSFRTGRVDQVCGDVYRQREGGW